MKYKKFVIENYRAIKRKIEIDLSKRIIPLVGVNECGKTTILKALLCFDMTNDGVNNSEHLKSIHNLYETGKKEPTKITSLIECNSEELIEMLDSSFNSINKLINTDKWKPEYQAIIDEIPAFKEDLTINSDIAVTRNITSSAKWYSAKELKSLSGITQDVVCRELVKNLPYILYNDDFTDRPEQEIKIADDANKSSSWEDIFDNVVLSASQQQFSLRDIFQENDVRQRNSMISDVTTYLDQALTAAWTKFAPKKHKIKTRLEVDVKDNILRVFMIEETGGVSRDFFINDRSKGFIWYYNFIMKVRFNPKKSGDGNSTVFLLDEPGSYLHEKAQEELCKKLKEISATEGCVIYCTHSPRLLDPEQIPLSSIMIVEKKKSEIIATPLPLFKTESKNNAAMQPVYEALQLPEYEAISKDEKILCVEGIYDKYAITCFCNLPKTVRIFPSTSAIAISENIQYFIAYHKKYVALWDCDDEGKRAKGRAAKAFGPYESEKFILLPEHLKGKVRMEEMIEADDYEILKNELHLPSEAKYESIIGQLYFNVHRAKIASKVSDATKNNFLCLEKAIVSKLG